MISVLIPVYNFDIQLLVKDLHQQLLEAGIPFEIRCYDDGSQENFKNINRQLLNPSTLQPFNLLNITYQELPENLGRARIRNVLAKSAKYPYLLFMDCDSKVVSPNYIKHYIEHLHPDTLLYGGRSYAPTPPDFPELYFHWHYGTQREQIPAEIRQRNPYHAFMTNNFLIPKAIFNTIRFDERLKQYGHEDTLFGLELQKRKIKIIHIDNPLEHIGLEDTDTFLRKTRQGVENLAFLATAYPQLETKLLNTYKILKKFKLSMITSYILKILQPIIIKKLHTEKVNLQWFDLYKLQLLMDAIKK